MWPELNIFPHNGSPGSTTSSSRLGAGPPWRHKKKKSVQIVEHFNQIYFMDCRSDLTREERHSCFFNDTDYAAMRQRDNVLSRNLDDSREVEPEIGLESRRDKNKRRRRMDECLMSVMLEQELRELDREPIDPMLLARLVLGYSSHSTKLAYDRAVENEVQVFGGRRGLSEAVMPIRSVSPTTPKEELGSRYTQQRQWRKEEQHLYSPDAFIQTTERGIRSRDDKMAAEFDPPHTSQPPTERFPHLAPRLSSSSTPFQPRTTYSFVETTPYVTQNYSAVSRRSSSLPVTSSSSSPTTSRSYSFVLPPFPGGDEQEQGAIPAPSAKSYMMTTTKARTTMVWYEDFLEDRWM